MYEPQKEIDTYHREYFGQSEGHAEKADRLNLDPGTVTFLIATQVCIPIICGFLSSVLFEMWKNVGTKADVGKALADIQAEIDNPDSSRPVELADIEDQARAILIENGYSDADAGALSHQLSRRIRSDLTEHLPRRFQGH